VAIVVRDLESGTDGADFVCTASVTLDGRERPLTFRRYGNHPDLARRDDTFDAHAVALLVPAMIRGEPLVIEGDIDEMLLVTLRGLAQETLRLMAPGWRRIAIDAAPRPAPLITDWSKGAATALSGGIDSMHLLRHRLLDPAVPEPLRVKVVVNHHVGAHDEDDGLFAERYGHARRIADRLGLPLVGVHCALGEAYRGMDFIHSVLVRNLAASLSLDHLFTAFHYASSEFVGGRPTMSRFDGIATLEPQLLPLFNTTRVSWYAFGGDTTRLQKTAAVIADERLCGDLNVCIRGDRRERAALNCGRCYKCARVLFHAEADGRLDAVSGTFDLDGFRRGRTHSLGPAAQTLAQAVVQRERRRPAAIHGRPRLRLSRLGACRRGAHAAASWAAAQPRVVTPLRAAASSATAAVARTSAAR
jgi:hypothetical protein